MGTFKPKTLKQVIEDKESSATQLASQKIADRKMLTKYSNGESIPRFDTALKLCSALQLSPKTLGTILGLDISGVPDDASSDISDHRVLEAFEHLASVLGFSVVPVTENDDQNPTDRDGSRPNREDDAA